VNCPQVYAQAVGKVVDKFLRKKARANSRLGDLGTISP
jgi:hypothetical protein